MNLPIVRWIHPKRQGMWLFAIMVATGLVAPALAESPLRDMDAQADGNSSSNRKRLVADHLPLTPAEAEQFWPVYDRFEQEMAILAERRTRWVAPEPKITTGWLARYAKVVTSAYTGAVTQA